MEKSEWCISLKSVGRDVFRGCWWIWWWQLWMPSTGRTKGPGGRHPSKTSIWVKHWMLKEESNKTHPDEKVKWRWDEGRLTELTLGDKEWKRQLHGYVSQCALTDITHTSSTAQVHASVTVESNCFQCVLAMAVSLGSMCLPHSGIWTKAEPTSGTHYGHSRSRRGELGASDVS